MSKRKEAPSRSQQKASSRLQQKAPSRSQQKASSRLQQQASSRLYEKSPASPVLGLDNADEDPECAIEHSVCGVKVVKPRSQWRAMGIDMVDMITHLVIAEHSEAGHRIWDAVLSGTSYPYNRDTFLVLRYMSSMPIPTDYLEKAMATVKCSKSFWSFWRLYDEFHATKFLKVDYPAAYRTATEIIRSQCAISENDTAANWVTEEDRMVCAKIRQAVHQALEDTLLPNLKDDYPVVKLKPSRLDWDVQEVLDNLDGLSCVVAGSAAFYANTNPSHFSNASDVDIWVYGPTDEARKKTFRDVLANISKARFVVTSKSAVTAILPDIEYYFQVIFTDCTSRNEVVHAFDMSVCRWAQGFCTRSAQLALESRCIVLPKPKGRYALYRIEKWRKRSPYFAVEPDPGSYGAKDPKEHRSYYFSYRDDDGEGGQTDLIISCLLWNLPVLRKVDDVIAAFKWVASNSRIGYAHTVTHYSTVDSIDTIIPFVSKIRRGHISTQRQDFTFLNNVDFAIDLPYTVLTSVERPELDDIGRWAIHIKLKPAEKSAINAWFWRFDEALSRHLGLPSHSDLAVGAEQRIALRGSDCLLNNVRVPLTQLETEVGECARDAYGIIYVSNLRIHPVGVKGSDLIWTPVQEPRFSRTIFAVQRLISLRPEL